MFTYKTQTRRNITKPKTNYTTTNNDTHENTENKKHDDKQTTKIDMADVVRLMVLIVLLIVYGSWQMEWLIVFIMWLVVYGSRHEKLL